MRNTQNPIVETVKKVMPAVVSIVILKSLEKLEKELPLDLMPITPWNAPELSIPEEAVDEHGMVRIGGGSGFIVDPNGIIVTNKHVIADPEAAYAVILNTGEKYESEILARDPINDVAILRIKAKNLPVVPLGDSSALELGETTIAIGNALGIFRNTVSAGIVSGLSRSIAAQPDPQEPVQEMRGLIQTDAAINAGNSGGPLVNLAGEAIGINAAMVYGAQNIGFAIPINMVRRDLDDLKEYGRVRRPLLGLRYLIINETLKRKMDLPADHGAFIVAHGPHTPGVIPGSPADRAGIKEKDIIFAYGSEKIDLEHTLQDFLENASVGDLIPLTVLRDGKEFTAKVKLTERK
ncbi:MAG: trypsin-like peptidase domain-containing protein [bacterium]|nr:trypsin-like peptidase domain-containing protein [bacterium]